MKRIIKPRLYPVMAAGALALIGLSCAQVLYSQQAALFARQNAPLSPKAEQDSVEQALKHLAELRAGSWLQGMTGLPSTGRGELIAPAPDVKAVEEAKVATDPVDPFLKGAVVVRSGNRSYVVMGAKRFRIGERIGSGESIEAISLQSVRLVSPEGRSRTVQIGQGIGVTADQAKW